MPMVYVKVKLLKVDTGADGNLTPIAMFVRLFPKISLDTLGKTIENGVTLCAYNNIPIKQFGTCIIKISNRIKQSVSFMLLSTVLQLFESMILKIRSGQHEF